MSYAEDMGYDGYDPDWVRDGYYGMDDVIQDTKMWVFYDGSVEPIKELESKNLMAIIQGITGGKSYGDQAFKKPFVEGELYSRYLERLKR